MFTAVRKIFRLFTKYPNIPGVQPDIFDFINKKKTPTADSPTLTVECVEDRFYFLLFGVISLRLADRIPIKVESVVTGSINGAVGSDLISALKRSPIINWLRYSRWIRAHSTVIDRVGYTAVTIKNPIKEIVYAYQAFCIWRAALKSKEGFRAEINGIRVDDLIIDSYIRFRPSYRFDINDRFVFFLIYTSIREIQAAFSYFRSAKPIWYLTSYMTYLEHGVAARVAVSCGVNVWSFANLNVLGRKVTEVTDCHTIDFSSYKTTFDTLDDRVGRLELAERALNARFSGLRDIATSYMSKSAYANCKNIDKSIVRDSVIIFLHDFFDSPHSYPCLLFEDFWVWINFTIEMLQQNNIKFHIKPHPNQVELSNLAIVKLQETYPGISVIPSDVSNYDLACADIKCGVTVYGSVALELAFFGIYSICCAKHPHHSFDFCKTAYTLAEYRKYLTELDVPPISRDRMREQAKAFYYMHNIYGGTKKIQLYEALVDLWVGCNKENKGDEEIKRLTANLAHCEAFDDFIDILVSEY